MFRSDTAEKFVTERVKPWKRLPKDVAGSPSLEMFNKQRCGILWPLLMAMGCWAEAWTWSWRSFPSLKFQFWMAAPEGHRSSGSWSYQTPCGGFQSREEILILVMPANLGSWDPDNPCWEFSCWIRLGFHLEKFILGELSCPSQFHAPEDKNFSCFRVFCVFLSMFDRILCVFIHVQIKELFLLTEFCVVLSMFE